MKLIVLALLSIAVFRASCRERPIDRDLENDDFYLINSTDLPLDTDSPDSWDPYYHGNIPSGPEDEPYTSAEDITASILDLDPGMKEIVTRQNKDVLRGGSKCKSEVVCSLLGGNCILNTTSCSGREIPNACGGGNCKCCFTVPFTENMEEIMYNLEAEFRAMAANFTITNSNLNTKLQSMLNSDLYSKLDNVLPNLTQVMNNMKKDLDAKLDSIKKEIVKECPEDKGYFKLENSDQCFKLFKDLATWEESKKKCEDDRLLLAKPDIALMLSLRKYIISKFGQNQRIWLGGRGTGSIVKWTRDGTSISNSESVWHPYFAGNRVATSMCLSLLTETHWLNSHPAGPLYTDTCTLRYFRLCELVM